VCVYVCVCVFSDRVVYFLITIMKYWRQAPLFKEDIDLDIVFRGWKAKLHVQAFAKVPLTLWQDHLCYLCAVSL
jgi:hypothetical protein